MKIILSRKGFDSKFGGCPSPILPDGTMLSMPIPGGEDNPCRYEDINYNGKSYSDIWRQLRRRQKEFDTYCHLDPDLRKDIRYVPDDWRAAFGQVDGSQTHLENQGVGIGDLFLFFGWFRETENRNGKFKYKPKTYGKHMLFGYLQIGEILKGEQTKKLSWHPHSDETYDGTNNTIYVASEKLIINGKETELAGYGTFKYSDELVLTKDGLSRSRWELPDFFKDVAISHHNANSFKNGYFQSAAIGQEFVISENDKVAEWAKGIILNNNTK